MASTSFRVVVDFSAPLTNTWWGLNFAMGIGVTSLIRTSAIQEGTRKSFYQGGALEFGEGHRSILTLSCEVQLTNTYPLWKK